MTAHSTKASNQERTVAVFGAAGHTGRFVVAELLRRGITPIAVVRDPAKAAAFTERGIEVRRASAEDPGTLDRALEGAAAVINCAGPFLDTADAVALAALRAGIHYLDVTAEQPSAQAVYETFDRAAQEAGVLVIPAMGFYGGFADLLVTAAMDGWDSADEIKVGIALDSWHPTQGTRITGEKNTARRMIVADGQLAPVPQPAAEMDWDFPQPFARQEVVELPFSEIVVIARHARSTEIRTYLSRTALRDVRDPATPAPQPVDETGRSAQVFLVEAMVRKSTEPFPTLPRIEKDMSNQSTKALTFRSLHVPGHPLVLFNVWDAGSAKAVAASGARALATGSWSVAAAHGFTDGERMPFDLCLANLQRIAEAIDLPVTVDLESGYGADPAAVGETVARALQAGAVGFNIEDSLPENGSLRDVADQAARIKVARAAADARGVPAFLNTRTDVFFRIGPEQHDEGMVEAALERGRLYADAGADGLFVPGLADERLIARLVEGSPLPVNIMAGVSTPPAARLAELGVARISHGPGPYLLVMHALENAARAALEEVRTPPNR